MRRYWRQAGPSQESTTSAPRAARARSAAALSFASRALCAAVVCLLASASAAKAQAVGQTLYPAAGQQRSALLDSSSVGNDAFSDARLGPSDDSPAALMARRLGMSSHDRLDPLPAKDEPIFPGLEFSPAPCARCAHVPCCCDNSYDWRLLPDGLIFSSYLAGVRESRFSSVWFREQDIGANWDIALGGRVGILRYGTAGSVMPQGWQLDVEGAAFPRLDQNNDLRDLSAVDFRFGIPLTYGEGPYQMKFAYYHLSSHLGDELLLRVPTTPRINYTRDALVWGHSYYIFPELRVYGELAYSFRVSDGAEPWEFQFGVDYAPAVPTGAAGAPFWAVNVHLREEVDFGGNLVLQAGWAWRGRYSGHMFRAGLQYYNGKSPQYEFFNDHEEQIGIGLWYDY